MGGAGAGGRAASQPVSGHLCLSAREARTWAATLTGPPAPSPRRLHTEGLQPHAGLGSRRQGPEVRPPSLPKPQTAQPRRRETGSLFRPTSNVGVECSGVDRAPPQGLPKPCGRAPADWAAARSLATPPADQSVRRGHRPRRALRVECVCAGFRAQADSRGGGQGPGCDFWGHAVQRKSSGGLSHKDCFIEVARAGRNPVFGGFLAGRPLSHAHSAALASGVRGVGGDGLRRLCPSHCPLDRQKHFPAL